MIYAFCSKHFITEEISNKLVLVVEEILQLLPLDDEVDIVIEYSEKTKQISSSFRIEGVESFLFSDRGMDDDDLSKVIDDDLSKVIIRGMCHDLSEQIQEGDYILQITL